MHALLKREKKKDIQGICKPRGRKPAKRLEEYKRENERLRTENELIRDFHAKTPNSKWVTDISYIHTRQGVLYLSMIRNLYDNSIVAYKTGAKCESGSGYDSSGYTQRKEEGRRRVAAPQ